MLRNASKLIAREKFYNYPHKLTQNKSKKTPSWLTYDEIYFFWQANK
jgi:hypothetical protein